MSIVDLKDEVEGDFTWLTAAGFAAAVFDNGPFLWTEIRAEESRGRIAKEDNSDESFWEYEDTEGKEGLAILEDTGCRETGAELFRFLCASVAASGNGTSNANDGMVEIEEYFRKLRFACFDDCGNTESISAECEFNIGSFATVATPSVETGFKESSSSP